MSANLRPTPLYGIDTSCTDKLRPGMLVGGAQVVAEAAYRRLTTPRGMLLEDPDYGRDVREYLSMEMTDANLARVPGELRNEVTKDDRIESCDLTQNASGVGASRSLEVILDCVCGAGPFTLSVFLTRTTVEVIIGKKAAA